MKNIQYNFYKIIEKLFKVKKQKLILRFFVKNGITIGQNCRIYSNILTTEPYLVFIGDNTTISSDVVLFNHDNSVSKVIKNSTDVFGKICIGNNCFIGARSIILPGVSLADNIIVAAGAVVTKSFNTSNIIVGGNPAKVIGTWEEFREKYSDLTYDFNGISYNSREKILKRENRLVEK